MTKRVGNFNENNNKKFKIDNDLNHLWGEDLDAGDVDDCFLLASQVCEQDIQCTQRNNVSILKPQNVFNAYENEESYLHADSNSSILPSYNAFKFDQRNLMTSSTQMIVQSNSKINVPSQSIFKLPSLNECTETKQNNNVCLTQHQLQSKLQSLQKECVVKEGEASILRSQLKEIRKTVEAEQAKKEQIWTDKLSVAQKEVEAARSDLEFKNLEIAKLKSKIVEITKRFNSEISMNAENLKKSDQNFENNKDRKNESDTGDSQYKIEIVLEYDTLMTAVIFAAMFNSVKPKMNQMSLKYNNKCNQYLETLFISELQKINENKNFHLSCIYSDVSALISCTTIEIDSEKCYSNINRILCVTRLVVQNFLDYLSILENNTQNEDIEQLDNLYLKKMFNPSFSNLSLFDSREWCENEIGIKPRQMITVVSEILPFSSYLQQHLLENKLIVNKTDDEMFRYPNNAGQKFDFLHLILSALKVIGNIRKADRCVGFFSAVTLLLTNIYLSSSLNDCRSLVLNITRELVTARPDKEAMKYLSRFFKTVSSNEIFASALCKMPLQRSLKIHSREGILSFNKDSCILQVYTVLYEDNFINKYDITDLDNHLNTLEFITNLLQSESLQLYFQETNYCECVLKINNLCMEIICEILKIYRNLLTREAYKYRSIIQYSLKIFNILNFKFSYLITVKPEYKFIIDLLLDVSEFETKDMNLEILENLNIQEDVSKISASSFDSIPFFN